MNTAPPRPVDRAGRREWLGLIVLALAVLLISVDATVLNLALPEITADLNPSSTQLLWIVDVYSFVLAGLLVTMGTLGDRIGRRRLLLIGSAGFAAGSLLAAFAHDAQTLIAARALLGVAGATLMPSTLSLIRAMFRDDGQRATAIGVWSAAAAAGAAAGPIFGGILLEHYWWGSVFLLALPVLGAMLVLGPIFLPESRNPDPGRFDLFSAALSMAAILPVVYGLKQIAAHGYSPWSTAGILGGLLVGVVFVRRQLVIRAPLIELRLLANRPFTVALLANLLAVFGLIGALFFGSQYLQLVAGLSPLSAGLHLLPGTITGLVGALTTPLLLRRVPARWLVSGALVMAAAGFASMVRLSGPSDAGMFSVCFAVMGLGMGAALTWSNDSVLSVVEPERAGAASAVSETGYELGTALAVAVLGSVLTHGYRNALRTLPDLPPAVRGATRESLASALRAAGQLPPAASQALSGRAVAAFLDGLHPAVLVGSAVTLLGGVQVACFLRSGTPRDPRGGRHRASAVRHQVSTVRPMTQRSADPDPDADPGRHPDTHRAPDVVGAVTAPLPRIRSLR